MRLRRLKDCREYTIDAQGTDIGRVRGFYFDDLYWTIRYIVVATGAMPGGREVLISTAAAKSRAWGPLHIRVNLRWEQVERAPSVNLRQPISRQSEIEQHNHYGWPYYWDQRAANADIETHLRSSEEVTGYKVAVVDGEIGKVEDFLLDDANWKIRWAVINTDGWLMGKRVLISPRWIRQVDWANRTMDVNLSREQIKDSPKWDPDKPVNRKYELQLHKHYQLPPYWTDICDESGET
ncbi:MAG: PRC-barrel domain-containing protein [Candidatus Acidiferrales bacterium]